jgi:hypothetical protein
MMLICVFVTVFYQKFLQTMNREQISISSSVVEEDDASFYNATTSEFMFVVGVGHWLFSSTLST